MTRRQRRGIRQTIMQKFLHTNYWFINSLVTMVTAEPRLKEPLRSINRSGLLASLRRTIHMKPTGEGFYLLYGDVTFFCNGEKTVLGTGGFIYLPGTQPHGFRVHGDSPATMMIVSPSQSTFGAFVKEMGDRQHRTSYQRHPGQTSCSSGQRLRRSASSRRDLPSCVAGWIRSSCGLPPSQYSMAFGSPLSTSLCGPLTFRIES